MTQQLTLKRPVSTWWWLRKRTYFVFVMRELSSIFIAWFVVFLMRLLSAVGDSRSAYDHFLDWASSPLVVALNVLTLVFITLHAVTWFSLTPQAMAVQVRGRAVPGSVIIAAQYVGLAIVSAFIFWLVTR